MDYYCGINLDFQRHPFGSGQSGSTRDLLSALQDKCMIGSSSPQPTYRKLKILMMTLAYPRPDQSGGGLLTYNYLSLLASRHHVSLYTYAESYKPRSHPWPEETARYREMYEALGIELLDGSQVEGIIRALHTRTFDVVIFEFWASAQLGIDYLRRIQPWAKVIIETVDITFTREMAAARLGQMDLAQAEANKTAELNAYAKSDALICISEEDNRALDECPGLRTRVVIPHMTRIVHRSARKRSSELLFIGGFAHAPNPDGIIWFAREIWPEILRSVPEARLRIIGSRVTPEVQGLGQLAGITVDGYVAEIDSACERAAILVAPLRFGGGVKIKVVEAMAHGMPVVTTEVGAQGLAVESADQIAIAEDAAGFARWVVRLLDDPDLAERIGTSGQRFIASTCSPEAILDLLERLLGSVVTTGRPQLPPPRWVAGRAKSRLKNLARRLASIRPRPTRRPRT